MAKYPAICVAAWSYVTAAVCMGATALLFVEQDGWEVPRQLWGPLVYWIFICSVIGYYVVTWATQYLPASQVLPHRRAICMRVSENVYDRPMSGRRFAFLKVCRLSAYVPCLLA